MKNNKQGFAVLTFAILLSVAGIVYTVNMARSQLIDNQVLANYYRNSEAFINAESGVNLILNKLNSVAIANELIENLPFVYPAQMSENTPYQVTVTKITRHKFQIVSKGQSQDASASRQISLQVYYSNAFDIPVAPVSSNGKLNINALAMINDGCEGLSKEGCRSPGNIAKQLIVSQPSAELEQTDLCTGDELQVNSIDENAIYGLLEDQTGETRFKEISNNQWGVAASSTGSIFDQVSSIEDMSNASSLFQRTFGINLEDAQDELSSSGQVVRIDMTHLSSLSCSDQLQDVSDDTSVIYIKGDCNIDQNDTLKSQTSEYNHFTVGSSERPKMVFIEGGTFITETNTTASVIGMLYFLPATHDVMDELGSIVYIDGVKQTQKDQRIDMAGIRVNGALLSEYNCSTGGVDTIDSDSTQQYLSARYDKTILNTLYQQMGMTAAASSYQLVAGTWRDF
ncbi:hypothetical protein E2R68_07870 [Psychromonas sp. RZ22]|uniref:hypothetical protein n=1 Tax=Psychromonas algarum TaxID=2555643 RepID=UPI001068BB82|nr:hypothetical protein [Psychromonas sp. RZ22]TEW54610.1 hypothetical protein E2R68_07870 [Psychromonas sp. RZ22]